VQRLSNKTGARKTLMMKLTPGVNFIIVLCTDFTLVDPESLKILLSHQYLFTLSGSAGIKAVRRTLMKLSRDKK